MHTNPETGLARLVASFENLLGRCQQFGSAYNPAPSRIQVPALMSKLADARSAITAVNTAKNNYNFATNAREVAFGNIRILATRIVNALEACGAPQQTIDDARHLIMKINGRRASKKSVSKPAIAVSLPGEAPTVEITTRSVSQLGFDAKLDNLSKLVLLVSSEPLYATNEPDLQVPALNATLSGLQNLNSSAILAQATLETARLQRNAIIHGSLTGLLDVAQQTKKYIKSAFGPSSPQYKQVSAIRMR